MACDSYLMLQYASCAKVYALIDVGWLAVVYVQDGEDMVGDPNKWAVRAIIASVVFASGFAATKSIVETNISFEDSTAGLLEQQEDTSNAEDDDRDGDGLVDRLEEKLGTDPDNPDTDGDGLSDSAEYFSGLDPLDG